MRLTFPFPLAFPLLFPIFPHPFSTLSVPADVLQFGNVCETHIYDKRDNLSLAGDPFGAICLTEFAFLF